MSERTVAPYGTWRSPISAAMLVEGGVSLSHVRLEDGAAYWLEGRPSEGGRSVIVRAAPGGSTRRRDAARASTSGRRCTSTAAARSSCTRRRLLRQLRRPAAVPAGSRGRPPTPITPEHGRARAIRRRARHCRTALDCSACASGTEDEERRQRDRRRIPTDGSGEADRHRRARLLLVAADLAGRHAARVDRRGITPTCRGTARSCTSRISTRAACDRRRSSPVRPGRSPSSSPSGPRTASCTSSRTGPAGGTSTATSTASAAPSVRWRPSSACRSGCSACSTYAFLDDGRIVCIWTQRRRAARSRARSADR